MTTDPINEDATGTPVAPVAVPVVPESMLEGPKIVDVPPIPGEKEPEDPNKFLIVRYDPFMQVVNGMSGSGAGNMRRLSEVLREAIDHDAPAKFQGATQAALAEVSDTAYEQGKVAKEQEMQSALDAANEHAKRLEEQIVIERDAGVEHGKNLMQSDIDQMRENGQKLEQDLLAANAKVETLEGVIKDLEKDLAEAKKPAVQRQPKNDEK